MWLISDVISNMSPNISVASGQSINHHAASQTKGLLLCMVRTIKSCCPESIRAIEPTQPLNMGRPDEYS